jgi:hypothetical protein
MEKRVYERAYEPLLESKSSHLQGRWPSDPDIKVRSFVAIDFWSCKGKTDPIISNTKMIDFTGNLVVVLNWAGFLS